MKDGTIQTKFIEHGKGKKVWDNGSQYIGDFVNGNADGDGTFYNQHGDFYDG